MSTAQYTPGPWRVNGTRIRDCQPGVDCIATMQVSNQANWEADARLMAAAPELLAELRRCAEQMEVAAGVLWFRADGLDTLHKLAANALRNSAEELRYRADQGRAAIAKAVQS